MRRIPYACVLLLVGLSTLLPSASWSKTKYHAPGTLLEEIEGRQSSGRRVRLSGKEIPGMPKIGWREWTQKDEETGEIYKYKSYQKITFDSSAAPLFFQEAVAGFTKPKYSDKHEALYWCNAAFTPINLHFNTELSYLLVYPIPDSDEGFDTFEGRLHRPERVTARLKQKTKRRLTALEKPLLYGFFSHRMIDPKTYGTKKERTITGTWGRYVKRINCSKKLPFSTYFEVPNALSRVAPSIRSVWMELVVRVDTKGKPVARPTLFARIIAYETKQSLFLIGQRAAPAYFPGAGGVDAAPIDIGDW